MARGGKTTQTSPGNQTPTHRLPNHKSRYERYYISGGDLYLVARAKHFCVHSYFFEREAQAECWKGVIDGLDCPSAEVRKRISGLHEDNPLDFDEDPEHIADFLWVFYNQDYGSYTTASLDKWVNILRLATKWGFPAVQGLAISYINRMRMRVVDKIKLYQDCDVARDHLLRLYVKLATRPRMLEREEFRVLDGDTLYAIVRARELLRAPVSVDPQVDMVMSPIRPEYDSEGGKVEAVVAAAFGITPEEVQALRSPATDNNPEGIN